MTNDQIQADSDSRLLARIDERTGNLTEMVKELRKLVDDIVDDQHRINDDHNRRIRAVEMNEEYEKRLRTLENSMIRIAAFSTVGATILVAAFDILKGSIKLP